MKVVRARDARQVPWKNGLGTTTELAVWPPGGDLQRADFAWRLSAAKVDTDGPFSRFDGCDRVLVVTQGAGLVLDHGEAAPTRTLGRLQPHAFAGEWSTTARLVDGPVVDFNLIHRRDVAATLRVVAGEVAPWDEPLDCAHLFVHVLAGATAATLGDDTVALAAGDSLWLQRPAGAQTLRLSPADAELVIVRVDGRRVAGHGTPSR